MGLADKEEIELEQAAILMTFARIRKTLVSLTQNVLCVSCTSVLVSYLRFSLVLDDMSPFSVGHKSRVHG